MSARAQLETFTLDSIPTLDVVVEGALELFAEVDLALLSIEGERPLVMGSGNAYAAGRLLFSGQSAVFANEAAYKQALKQEQYDAVVIISASGSKHAVGMVEAAEGQGVPVHLVTNNPKAPAAERLSHENVFVYPKNREPYTYNTSTYLGPLLARTEVSPADLLTWLQKEVSAKLLRNFADYSAFTFILPDDQAPVCSMISTKFDELFGGKVTGRAFTESEIMHAKTVVQSGDELFIALGVENNYYGLKKNRLSFSMSEQSSSAAFIAASYFIVGHIQRAHPPYFAQNIERYCQEATLIFGHPIKPIVE